MLLTLQEHAPPWKEHTVVTGAKAREDWVWKRQTGNKMQWLGIYAAKCLIALLFADALSTLNCKR
eukprot:10081520-Prorocentrum_lima.AAC.1